MPHNDNYLRNILRQWLRDYHPMGEVWGGGLPPPQKKYNAIQVKLFASRKDTRHNAQFGVLMRPPSKISTHVDSGY